MLAGVLLGALVACSAAPGSAEDAIDTETLVERLEQVPAVVAVEASGETHVLVTVDAGAADEAVLDAAREIADIARTGEWEGDEIVLEPEHPGLDPETDLRGRAAWSQRVFPDDPDEVRAALAEELVIAATPGVAVISVIDGWPHVALASLDEAVGVVEALSALPRFAAGATYSYGADAPRLKFVHIPERMTLEGIAAVVRIARECAECDVELAAMTTGPRWPELYAAHLTPEEVAIVAAQLRDPALADVDPEGYSIPFQLSYVGPGGPVYTFGTFGDVPDTSS